MCSCCCKSDPSQDMPLQVASGSSSILRDGDSSIQHDKCVWYRDERIYHSTFQVIRFYIFCIVFGILSLCISYYFLTWLSPWKWQGSSQQLWGVTIYTFVFPLGFMLTMTGISGLVTIKEITPKIRAFIMAFFALSALFSLVEIVYKVLTHRNFAKYISKYTN